MKNSFIKFSCAILLLASISACARQPKKEPKKDLGDDTTSVAPVSKARSEIFPPHAVPDIKKCICVQLWMPVCGENGKTYSNSCFANCAGVKYTQGECAKTITE